MMSHNQTVITETHVNHLEQEPFRLEYGKVMMWFLLITDLFSFGTLLISSYAYRFSFTDWPSTDLVFTSFPFLSAKLPLLFVGVMTFILIISSLTMALAVDAGNSRNKVLVTKYLFYTILGGFVFLGCQAWEWNHLIHEGVSLTFNPWGNPVFSSFFFLITGFHGLHVLSGVILLVILFINVKNGVYEKRGHYLMVEKIGLYWHFVDVVWVFVFTFFYLI